jgi:hypothetical protein
MQVLEEFDLYYLPLLLGCCLETVRIALLACHNTDYDTVVVNSKREGVTRSWRIDNVVGSVVHHKAVRWRVAVAFVDAVHNRECAHDLPALVDPSSMGARENRRRRIEQLNFAEPFYKGVLRGIGFQNYVSYQQ